MFNAAKLTFWADEAPADVDMLVVAAAFSWCEVIGTHYVAVSESDTPSRYAVIIGMICHRASDTAGYLAWDTKYNEFHK